MNNKTAAIYLIIWSLIAGVNSLNALLYIDDNNTGWAVYFVIIVAMAVAFVVYNFKQIKD